MSRCFPFPPPGYEGKNKRVVPLPDEAAALIQESIKREQDKAEKERRKEKKRQKKEKKKKEKEEKTSLKGGSGTKNHKHKGEGSSSDYQKQKKCEIEQLERSGLTEEHGPPSVPKLCDSSDSTQNSGKRKKPSSPLEGSHTQSTMLRIRLPIVVKQKDPEELHTKEKLCSSSIRADSTSFKRAKIDPHADISGRSLVPAQCSSALGTAAAADIGPNPSLKQSSSIKRAKIDPNADIKQPTAVSGRSLAPARCSSALGKVAAADIGPNPSLKQASLISRRLEESAQCSSEPGAVAAIGSHPGTEQLCSTSGRTEVPVQDSSATPVELSMNEISSLSDKQLRRVLKKWIPPVIEMETDSSDMDWLFDVPPRREPVMPKVSHVATCHEGSSLWPKARYLPEVETYALPYTVPF